MVDMMTESEKQLIEWYKAEYKLAYDRYENIYKSIWSIFQMMSAISLAILAVGAAKPDLIPPALVGSVAPLPLLFWWWVTFGPLNRYGDESRRRLGEIERQAEFVLGASN